MDPNPFRFIPANQRRTEKKSETFEQLEAMELYCSKCGRAVPVRKFLLLVLPEGDRYEYRCQFCGTNVGNKVDRSGQYYGILQG